MFFFFCATVGTIIFILAIAFLWAVIYHLKQYRLPNQSLKKIWLILFSSFGVLILFGAFFFFSIPWEEL